MNLDIFRSDNKTGKFSREKWIMENYIEEWEHITKFAENYGLKRTNMVHRILSSVLTLLWEMIQAYSWLFILFVSNKLWDNLYLLLFVNFESLNIYMVI